MQKKPSMRGSGKPDISLIDTIKADTIDRDTTDKRAIVKADTIDRDTTDKRAIVKADAIDRDTIDKQAIVKADAIDRDTIDKQAIVNVSTIHMQKLDLEQTRKGDIIIDVVLCLTPLGALLVWCLSLQSINVRMMNDLGLISVLSPGMIVASGILVVSFILTLQRKKFRTSLLALHLVCILLILYATPTLV